MGGSQGGLAELRNRLLFVFFALLVYRIGTHIPLPGINPDRLRALFEQNQGGILDLFNMFSGGALERMSILALNVMPYITSSIIMNLMSFMYPKPAAATQGRGVGPAQNHAVHPLRHAADRLGAGPVPNGHLGQSRASVLDRFHLLLRVHCRIGDRGPVHDVAR